MTTRPSLFPACGTRLSLSMTLNAHLGIHRDIFRRMPAGFRRCVEEQLTIGEVACFGIAQTVTDEAERILFPRTTP